ncbi:MAG TPA: hypothetical protein VE782_07035, partial [Myxococcaceae bacterium]|nr:hypothetical protein [Myxococcaceae bacterium]
MLPDLDAVNFARALDRFDLVAQAPHFPGYPVYVAMARLVARAGAGDVLALALPGLGLGALAVVALAVVLQLQLAPPGAVAAAVLWTLLPMPVLFGATPGSDGAGVALLVLALAAALATSAPAAESTQPHERPEHDRQFCAGPELSAAHVGSGPELGDAGAGSGMELDRPSSTRWYSVFA